MSFNPEFDSGGGGTDGSEDVDSSPDPGVDTTTETTDIDVGELLNRQRQTTDSRTETQEDTEVDFRDIGGDPVDSGGEPDISGPGPNGDVMDEDIGSAGETDVRPDSGTQEGPTADDLTIPDSPTDAAETTDTMDGRVFESVSEFEQTIEQQTGREISQGDEFTIENGSIRFSGAFLASVSRERAREAGRDLTEPASGPFQFDVEGGVPALASGGLEVGTGFFDEPELEPVMQPTDISGLELGDVVAEERQETREDLERQLEQQVGTDLGPGDIEFQEEDGQITATLSEAGERRVQIDRAPIVGAAETLGVFEPEARDVAGAAVTFREFRQEQRERFVEPSLQSLREATGLEEEIEDFEQFREGLAAGEERLFTRAQEELAALGAGITDTASPGIEAVERALPNIEDPLIQDPIVEVGEITELAVDAASPVGEAVGRAFPSPEDPLVRDPIEATEDLIERGTELVQPATEVVERAFPSPQDPLVRDPIESFEALADEGTEGLRELEEAAGPAFPAPEDPLFRDPIEAGGDLADAGGDALDELSTVAGRAFPAPGDPLIQDPIESTEDLSEQATELIEGVGDIDVGGERSFVGPAAATAVTVGTRAASLTPPGRAVAGLVLAGGAVASAFEELPPEQQLEIATAVGTASAPVERAQQALTGPDFDSPTVRAEQEQFDPQDAPLVPGPTEIEIDPDTGEAEVVVPEILEDVVIFPPEEGALPPDQAPPELEIPIEEAARRERLGDALTFPRDRPLAIQEDPIFLPEVLVPTAPQSQFTAGRFTPPEVPTDTADPTEPFGGSEVPLDDDLEGTETAEDFVFPGPEVPTPGQPAEEFAEPSPVLGAAQQQETILRRPDPAIPQDPADVARQTGPGGPAFIIGRDPRVAPRDPVLETPGAEIDLPLVRPELGRVLREGPELTAEDRFETALAAAEVGGQTRPGEPTGIFGFSDERERERLAAMERAETTAGEGQRPDQVTAPAQTPQQTTAAVTAPRLAQPGATTVPTSPGPGFGTPTVNVPEFDTFTPTSTVTPRTPAEEALPALELESEDPRRRERDFEEFEREFLEPVISPTEALEADRGGPEAMDLSDDMT